MQIYRWWSETLKQYADGHILVMAETVDEARTLALASFETWLPIGKEHLFVRGQPYDEDAAEDLDKLRAKMAVDIAKDPVEQGVAFFIDGSR